MGKRSLYGKMHGVDCNMDKKEIMYVYNGIPDSDWGDVDADRIIEDLEQIFERFRDHSNSPPRCFGCIAIQYIVERDCMHCKYIESCELYRKHLLMCANEILQKGGVGHE